MEDKKEETNKVKFLSRRDTVYYPKDVKNEQYKSQTQGKLSDLVICDSDENSSDDKRIIPDFR